MAKLAGFGLMPAQIALTMLIDPRTLLKYYGQELFLGQAKWMATQAATALRRSL